MYPKVHRTLWDYNSTLYDYERRKHNEPIATIIKGFLDKKGGKVSASRREIHNRFYALDWKYQKQILYAFLQSGRYITDAFLKEYGDLDDYKGADREEYLQERITEFCLKQIPSEYINFWGSTDLTNRQAILDVLEQRHKKHIDKREQESHYKVEWIL